VSRTEVDFDVAIIGAGSVAEALVGHLADSGLSIVVFEPELVGGECPFLACMPSKAMLHDVGTGRTWSEAVRRRDEIVSHLDDSDHADGLTDQGVTLVRERAAIAGPGVVRAGGVDHTATHIVIATGARPIAPDIDGLDLDHDRVWTSRDALTASDRPDSVVMIGGGVIGSELAYLFAGFGATVTTLDESDRPIDSFHPEVSRLIGEHLTNSGVDVVNGISVARVELTDTEAAVHLADGTVHRAERLVVATGRRPQLSGLGLETIGVTDVDEIDVDDRGCIVGADHVWVAGDAAGREQYTHVANAHAAVIADQLVGSGSRRYGDSVIPACIFIEPPVFTVGPQWTELQGDDDVVWAEVDVDPPRNSTDEHATGFLALAARRSTGCLVAANGIGARFDELATALVIAIDGEVPVDRLARTIQPFPTVGGVLGDAFGQLASALSHESD
jgi:pyruvate/2-oxoglutarate dehydrogenase complex dihydrolipoamide dehydrogenase (E3) component